MAKEDLLPFKYDAKTNTVFNTSGEKIGPVSRTKPRTKSWTHAFFDLSARLLAWYVLYMIFFACPPNARLDPTTPAVCRRVDVLKQSALPYIKPYYDTYAEPFLARAHPYLQKGQGYYEQFGAPTLRQGQDLWVKEASPRIKHGYATIQDLYSEKIHPVLDRLILQRSRDVYNKYLDPHVQTVGKKYDTLVHPHVQNLQMHSVKVYNERIVPAYNAAAPRIQHAFHTVENKYATEVEPRIHALIHWIFRTFQQVIIPRVTILWGVHVQPQLDRIYDNLFRNREAKRFASKIVEEGRSTQSILMSHISSQYTENVSPATEDPSPPSPTPTPSDAFSALDEYDDDDDDKSTTGPDEPLPISAIQDERPTLDRPVHVDALLENWRAKIRQAGVEAEEIFLDAVEEIAATEEERETSIAENMILELENRVTGEIASLENTIIYLAKKGKASGQDDPRIKELNKAIQASGKSIRNHAVDIRNYLKTIKERFESKIIDRRSIAWRTMDDVVGKAQTEIGNLWMWLADITYQDWKQYHGLKDMTNSIKHRIHAAAAGPHFDTMAEIQEEAEAQINAVAKQAAGKLAQLKEVGREKILLGDASENFGPAWIPVGVEMAVDNVASKVSETVHGSETPTDVMDQVMEGMLAAKDAIADVADDVVTKIGEAIYGASQGVVDSIVSDASRGIVGEEPLFQSKVVSSAQDVLSSAGEDVVDGASRFSEAVIGSPQGIGDSTASKFSAAVDATSESVVGSVVSQAGSVAGEAFAGVSSSTIEDLPNASDIVDTDKFAADSVRSLATEALSSASGIVSNAASLAGEGFVIVQEGAQRVFKSSELGVVEKAKEAAASLAEDIARKVSEIVSNSEPGIAEKVTEIATSIGEQIASKASEVGYGIEPEPLGEGGAKTIYGTEAAVAEKATEAAASIGEGKAIQDIYGTESEKATDAIDNLGETSANKTSEAIYGTEPGDIEKASNIASNIASDANEIVVGKEPGTIEKVASAAESVLDEATAKVAEIGNSASSLVSSVASESTEAYGAATSNVWENK